VFIKVLTCIKSIARGEGEFKQSGDTAANLKTASDVQPILNYHEKCYNINGSLLPADPYLLPAGNQTT